MSPVVGYADVENVVKAWLATTTVAPLVQRSAGVYSIYLGMPKASPVPSVILTLISGYPGARNDIPQLESRIQFDCWGTTRDQAGVISRTLCAELESLSRIGVYYTGATLLASAQVQTMRWLPDPESDTPRYIVDALITTVT